MEKSGQILWKEFVKDHHLLQLAVYGNIDGTNELWCCSAFYAYKEWNGKPYLVITSSTDTKHIKLALSNQSPVIVSGTISLETEVIGKIQGLQFSAVMERQDNSITNSFRLCYLKRFPYAILNGSDLWTLELKTIKFTDNRLGFGTKYIENF